MRTKHICVLIIFSIKGEVGTVNMFQSSSNVLTDHSKAVSSFVDPSCVIVLA